MKAPFVQLAKRAALGPKAYSASNGGVIWTNITFEAVLLEKETGVILDSASYKHPKRGKKVPIPRIAGKKTQWYQRVVDLGLGVTLSIGKVGECVVADQVARRQGGREGHPKPPETDQLWIFPSEEQAVQFYFVVTMLSCADSTFFESLRTKATLKVKSLREIDKVHQIQRPAKSQEGPAATDESETSATPTGAPTLAEELDTVALVYDQWAGRTVEDIPYLLLHIKKDRTKQEDREYLLIGVPDFYGARHYKETGKQPTSSHAHMHIDDTIFFLEPFGLFPPSTGGRKRRCRGQKRKR